MSRLTPARQTVSFQFMSATLQQVAGEALSLSLPDRAELMRILLVTLDEEPSEGEAEVEQSWEAEVEKRVDDIISGRVKTIPAETVFDKLRAKFG